MLSGEHQRAVDPRKAHVLSGTIGADFELEGDVRTAELTPRASVLVVGTNRVLVSRGFPGSSQGQSG